MKPVVEKFKVVKKPAPPEEKTTRLLASILQAVKDDTLKDERLIQAITRALESQPPINIEVPPSQVTVNIPEDKPWTEIQASKRGDTWTIRRVK